MPDHSKRTPRGDVYMPLGYGFSQAPAERTVSPFLLFLFFKQFRFTVLCLQKKVGKIGLNVSKIV